MITQETHRALNKLNSAASNRRHYRERHAFGFLGRTFTLAHQCAFQPRIGVVLLFTNSQDDVNQLAEHRTGGLHLQTSEPHFDSRHYHTVTAQGQTCKIETCSL